jgi:glyoxylase-like metal-dependent hydrolase (beta-lactamase superfamily II)
MNPLAAGLSYFDLHFQGIPWVIATVVFQGDAGVALVDPGPSSALPTLRATLEGGGIKMADVTDLLLTHIHLDHAGATGTLVRENPKLRVYVHEKGAPHMADPGKLVASASRLYGEAMDRLWGEILPVPAANMVSLGGGERLRVGGREMDVAYTPGHASHHVSYFSADTGIAFIGDTGGIRLHTDGYTLPATPPPDIDLESWRDSFGRIRGWNPSTVFLTHFGPYQSAHLTAFAESLERTASLAKRLLDNEGSDEDHECQFVDEIRRWMRQEMGDSDVQTYDVAARLDLSWRGLARYWRKRQ